MKWGAPEWFLLVPVVILIAMLVPRAWRGIPFPMERVARDVEPSMRRRFASTTKWLRVTALVLAALALARPERGVEASSSEARGIDIQLVLDVSSSMQQMDLVADKSRLDVSIEVVDQFVAGRTDDRIGLMTFAMYPRVNSPLTLDHDAVRATLKEVRPVRSSSAEDGTAIGLAIAAGVMRLRDASSPSKIMVLLTDGRETRDPIAQAEGAQLAVTHHVKLYTIAAGRRVGRWAKELTQLAEETGGRGFVARDADVLASIYEEISTLETAPWTPPPITTWAPIYPWFLFLALLVWCGVIPAEQLLFRRGGDA